MSNVHANPDQIEQFATRLAIFGHNVREELAHIHVAFDQLSETWIDEAHERYGQQFAEMVPPISRLLEETPDHVSHLLRKAEELRTFLSR